MSAANQVRKDMVVSLEYEARLADGELIDASGELPLRYIHGHGQLISGLEKALAGKQAGTRQNVTIPPEEAYGSRAEDAVAWFPRKVFPGQQNLAPGMVFEVEDPDGDLTAVHIREVETERVLVDYNHPLAGQTLQFEVAIVDVRPATATELAHGHVHNSAA